MPKIACCVAELSGDLLAAETLQTLKTQIPDLSLRGVTGPHLRAIGCETLADAESLSVSGITEAVLHVPRLWKLRQRLVREILMWKPDCFLGVDAPDFNLGLERKLREAGVPTFHYVSPTVWAWRPRRVKQVDRAVDGLFCLFPFEPAYYSNTSVRALFVGHPLADRLYPARDIREARRVLALNPDQTTVALVPGSRRHELDHMAGLIFEAARQLSEKNRSLQFVVPIAYPELRNVLVSLWEKTGNNLPVLWLDRQAPQAMQASDVALVASGTVTLEGMLVGCPMVVAYRFSAISVAIAKGILGLRVSWASFPNLLADEALVPEFLQNEAKPPVLAHAVQDLLDHPDRCQALRARYSELAGMLRCGSNRTVAAELAAAMGGASPGPNSNGR
jgi:lipid-A-disaccharide synthase